MITRAAGKRYRGVSLLTIPLPFPAVESLSTLAAMPRPHFRQLFFQQAASFPQLKQCGLDGRISQCRTGVQAEQQRLLALQLRNQLPDPLQFDALIGSHCRHSAASALAGGRISGNRITSRIDFDPVRIMVSRSMPMPSPAVGGKPYPSART